MPEHSENKNSIWQGIRAVIFDMDGLLVDSEPIHLEALNLVLKDYGDPVGPDENAAYVGQTELETWRMVMERRGIPADLNELSKKRAKTFSRILLDNGVPRLPGAMELVRKCKAQGYPIAIASSTPRDTILEVLAASGFDKEVKTIVSAYDPEVAKGKPAPDVFLRAASLLGVPPGECLVLEDSGPGIQAAKSAGMKCVTVPGKHVKDKDRQSADLILESLTQMPTPPHIDTVK